MQIDEQVDERLDIEIVPVGTAAQYLRAESDASQPAPQHVVVRDTGIGDVGGDSQWKVDDPAPVGLVPVIEDVPLRIQGAADAYRRTGFAVIGELDPGGQGTGIRSDLAAPAGWSEPSSPRPRHPLPVNANRRTSCAGSPTSTGC